VGKVTLVVDKKRVDQSRVRLAEVEIGDETGTVSLRARDEQIDLLEDVSRRSGAVVLRNCTLELYQGKHIRLAVTKWGKLSVYPDNVASTPPAPSKMNFDRNFSAIDLSAVASEMVDIQSDVAYTGSRQPKQPDTQEPGARPSSSKPSCQGKHQQSQSSTRRGGRERRQSKGKQGGVPSTQPHYLSSSGEHGTVDTRISPMRFTGMHHPYPMYDQSMDLRQYHFTGQQDPVLASGSAQQLMIQRQYELQQHHLHQMYHGQQDRLRTGISPSPHLQSQAMMVPPGSFDTSDYHHPSYSSTGSSPVLVPVPMPGAHLTGTIRLPPTDPQQGTQHDPAEGQSAQLMSISPDDSSQMSHGRMNPDATAFSPSYIAPPQGN
jgi:replication factor A1